jgi:hypothetical protein
MNHSVIASGSERLDEAPDAAQVSLVRMVVSVVIKAITCIGKTLCPLDQLLKRRTDISSSFGPGLCVLKTTSPFK